MNKLLLPLCLSAALITGCSTTIMNVATSFSSDPVALTDKLCPVSTWNTETEQYYVFKSEGGRELGCYANIKSKGGYRFVLSGRRNITGENLFYFFTYAELVNRTNRYNDSMAYAIANMPRIQPAPSVNVYNNGPGWGYAPGYGYYNNYTVPYAPYYGQGWHRY